MLASEKKKILCAELDDEQLSRVIGGDPGLIAATARQEEDSEYCERMHYRPFEDCVSSVEEGSRCSLNDACFGAVIEYIGYVSMVSE